MIIKLNCIYGDKNPGDVIDEKNEAQAKAMLANGAASLPDKADAKPAKE